MANNEFSKIQIIFIAGLVLIVPFIIVFQLTKADITIDFDSTEPFKNTCFLGESECTYVEELGVIELREDDTYWWILGEDVWCVKINQSVAEPVSDPIGVITSRDNIECNDVTMFDKAEWDFSITRMTNGNEVTIFTFTMKGQ